MNLNFHHYHHGCDRPEPPWVAEIRAILQRIETTMSAESDAIANIETALTALGTSVSGEVTELQKISQELTALAGQQGADNSGALNDIASRITATASTLDQAAAAATSADLTPPAA